MTKKKHDYPLNEKTVIMNKLQKYLADLHMADRKNVIVKLLGPKYGWTYEEIGELFGISKQAVHKIASKLVVDK